MTSLRPVVFVWDHGGDDVFICLSHVGDGQESFTAKLHPDHRGFHHCLVSLTPGQYQYRFAVNGQWTFDLDLPSGSNDRGHFSNWMVVDDATTLEVVTKQPVATNITQGIIHYLEMVKQAIHTHTSAKTAALPVSGMALTKSASMTAKTRKRPGGMWRYLVKKSKSHGDVLDGELHLIDLDPGRLMMSDDESGMSELPELEDAMRVSKPFFVTEWQPCPSEEETTSDEASEDEKALTTGRLVLELNVVNSSDGLVEDDTADEIITEKEVGVKSNLNDLGKSSVTPEVEADEPKEEQFGPKAKKVATDDKEEVIEADPGHKEEQIDEANTMETTLEDKSSKSEKETASQPQLINEETSAKEKDFDTSLMENLAMTAKLLRDVTKANNMMDAISPEDIIDVQQICQDIVAQDLISAIFDSCNPDALVQEEIRNDLSDHQDVENRRQKQNDESNQTRPAKRQKKKKRPKTKKDALKSFDEKVLSKFGVDDDPQSPFRLTTSMSLGNIPIETILQHPQEASKAWSEEQLDMISDDETEALPSSFRPRWKNDIFRDVRIELSSIQRSQSQTDIIVRKKMEKEDLITRFLTDLNKENKHPTSPKLKKKKLVKRSQSKHHKETDEPSGVLPCKSDQQINVEPSFQFRSNEEEEEEESGKISKLEEIMGPIRAKPISSPQVFIDKEDRSVSGLAQKIRLKPFDPKCKKINKDKAKVQTPPAVASDAVKNEEISHQNATENEEVMTPDASKTDYDCEPIIPHREVENLQKNDEFGLGLRIGINGFEKIARLVLISALRSEMNVAVINEPFTSIDNMASALRHDLTCMNQGQKAKKKLGAMDVRVRSDDEFVVMGKVIRVFKAKDRSQVPWDAHGVSHIVESAPDAAPDKSAKPVPRTIIQVTSPSINSSTFAVGVNDDVIRGDEQVTAHVSPAASALLPILSLVQQHFGIQTASFTIMKSIRIDSQNLRCPNLGPGLPGAPAKWDFGSNLVPSSVPDLEQEVFQIMPKLRGHLSGLCIYVPTPDVSMIDLTLVLKTESDHLYREVCSAMASAADSTRFRNIMKYLSKKEPGNSASSLFTGTPYSCVVDAKHGVQVSPNTVKLLIWFDNDHGYAERIVDLLKLSHDKLLMH